MLYKKCLQSLSCFEHDHKHVLRLLRLHEDQALQNTCYGQNPSWNELWCEMMWCPQNVPEKVLETSSVLFRAKFDALFPQIFQKRFLFGFRPESFWAWRNGGMKKVSGYVKVYSYSGAATFTTVNNTTFKLCRILWKMRVMYKELWRLKFVCNECGNL